MRGEIRGCGHARFRRGRAGGRHKAGLQQKRRGLPGPTPTVRENIKKRQQERRLRKDVRVQEKTLRKGVQQKILRACEKRN